MGLHIGEKRVCEGDLMVWLALGAAVKRAAWLCKCMRRRGGGNGFGLEENSVGDGVRYPGGGGKEEENARSSRLLRRCMGGERRKLLMCRRL